MKRIIILTATVAILAGCATKGVDPAPEPTPAIVPKASAQDMFMKNLQALCGKSFVGNVISTDAADIDWRKVDLVIHVRDCSYSEVKIPLHVGENRGRTWIVSKTETGLTLEHDHRHEDGSMDVVSMYGGDTQDEGTATQQKFHAHQYSKDLFMREFLTASVDNIWAIDIIPGVSLTYSLTRPERDFRAQFDLTKPVATPPPVWGAEN